MAINEHPKIGSIVTCDFTQGFKEPEMIKNRPVIVISPKITARPKLCTVVPLSKTPPRFVLPYHMQINISPPLPHFESEGLWVKGDMITSVGFHRLNLIRYPKDRNGKRVYYYETLNAEQLKKVRACVLNSLAMGKLIKNL